MTCALGQVVAIMLSSIESLKLTHSLTHSLL
jgi:hypothetical protein